MSAQHTPGPWHMVEHDLSPPTVHDPDGVPVCRIGGNNSLHDGYMADARLIAAAPDLLAALQAVIGLLEKYPRMSQDHHMLLNAREIGRAAIAKATGEQS